MIGKKKQDAQGGAQQDVPQPKTAEFKGKESVTEQSCNLEQIEVKRRNSEYTKYKLPTKLNQLNTVLRLEFKQYFKSIKLLILYGMAILLPVMQMCNLDIIGTFSVLTNLLSGGNSMTSLQYLHYCLILMPTVMVITMTFLCGRTISQEYEGRTCFLNLPLPVDRWIFFTGKFIAITITSFSIILVGYGMAMIATNVKFGSIAVTPVLLSIAIAFVAMLAFVATGMFFSSLLKKRGGLVSLAIIMFGLPLIPVLFSLIINKTPLPGWLDIFMYTPPFSTDAMLIALGWDPTMSLSGLAIGTMYTRGPALIGTFIASLLWAIGFFVGGIVMFNRREV